MEKMHIILLPPKIIIYNIHILNPLIDTYTLNSNYIKHNYTLHPIGLGPRPQSTPAYVLRCSAWLRCTINHDVKNNKYYHSLKFDFILFLAAGGDQTIGTGGDEDEIGGLANEAKRVGRVWRAGRRRSAGKTVRKCPSSICAAMCEKVWKIVFSSVFAV